MEPKSSNAAIPSHNEPRDLLSRLYREIGISAVAAALEPSTFLVDAATKPATPKHAQSGLADVKAA